MTESAPTYNCPCWMLYSYSKTHPHLLGCEEPIRLPHGELCNGEQWHSMDGPCRSEKEVNTVKGEEDRIPPTGETNSRADPGRDFDQVARELIAVLAETYNLER